MGVYGRVQLCEICLPAQKGFIAALILNIILIIVTGARAWILKSLSLIYLLISTSPIDYSDVAKLLSVWWVQYNSLPNLFKHTDVILHDPLPSLIQIDFVFLCPGFLFYWKSKGGIEGSGWFLRIDESGFVVTVIRNPIDFVFGENYLESPGRCSFIVLKSWILYLLGQMGD